MYPFHTRMSTGARQGRPRQSAAPRHQPGVRGVQHRGAGAELAVSQYQPVPSQHPLHDAQATQHPCTRKHLHAQTFAYAQTHNHTTLFDYILFILPRRMRKHGTQVHMQAHICTHMNTMLALQFCGFNVFLTLRFRYLAHEPPTTRNVHTTTHSTA